MKTRNLLFTIAIIPVVIVVTSWMLWLVNPKKEINILIVDKSVMDQKRTEHKALFYAINQGRFVNHNGHKYDINHDYYGFIPLKPYKDKNYELRRIRLSEVDTLIMENEVAYFADTYGVYFNEWFSGVKRQTKSQQIIGGLTQNDYLFLRGMLEKGKTVIAEHNFLSVNTDPLVRSKFEELIRIKQTGWVGKYYSQLDSGKLQIPVWIFDAYRRNTGLPWTYKGSGIILTKGTALVVVLQDNVHLQKPIPQISLLPEIARSWDLPEIVSFSGWFEIVQPDSSFNELASFTISASDSGNMVLQSMGIPSRFPAILKSVNPYKFWYFTGDFSDQDIPYSSYRFKGASLFMTRSSRDFAVEFYIPFMQKVLDEIRAEIPAAKSL